MTKRLLSLVLAIALCIVGIISVVVLAANSGANNTDGLSISFQIDNPIMTVNGREKEIDPGMGTTPVVINDRTLLPIRAVVEEMGGNVEWNNDTQTVTLTCNEDKIRLVIDDKTAYLNDTASTLDTAPMIINDRTMLPIRFIAEGFNFNVDWNETERIVTVSKKAGNTSQTTPPVSDAEHKILIAYFTVPETDDVDTSARASRVASNGEVLGNVEFIAQTIQEETGADVFTIETVQQYPGTHDELLKFAAEEMDKNARPELKTKLDNLDDYDTVFLGFPIWNADLPMRCIRFWKNMISAAKQSFRSPLTEEAALREQ